MARDADATREDRLKAALKANMGRRKAQSRMQGGTRIARVATEDATTGQGRDATGETGGMDGDIDGTANG